MTEPLEYRSANTDPGLPTGLVVLGIITLLLAALGACVTVLSPLGLLAATRQTGGVGPDTAMIAQIVAAVAIYLLATVVFTIGGIGMLRGKRWVRPYTLAISVPAIGFGISGAISSVLALGMMFSIADGMPTDPTAPFDQRQAMRVGMMIGVVGSVLFGVGLPLVYALYFRRADVAAFLETRGPARYLGDHLPTPALALALWLVLAGVVGLISMANPVLPAFTTYLTGGIAAFIAAAVSVLLFLAAFLVWKRNFVGWIFAAVVLLIWSTAVTVTPALAERNMFAAMSDQQIQLQQIGELMQDSPAWPLVVGGLVQIVLIIVGLLWARPHVAESPALS